MARGKVKADHRADNRGGPWAGLPHVVIDSPAYRDLSLWGRATLVELVREMNGYNNGAIGLSQRQLSERLRTTNFRAIGRAIAELVTHGFVDVSTEGRWKQRLAREYRLTFVNTGAPGHYRPATNDYQLWQPQKSCADDVSAEKSCSADDVSASPRSPADDVSARIDAHRGKTAKLASFSADDVSSLISKPYRGARNEPLDTPENAGGPVRRAAA